MDEQQQFLTAQPFPHLVLDDFAPPATLRTAAEQFARADRRYWHSYTGADERGKASCNNPLGIPWACADLLAWLNSPGVLARWAGLADLDELAPDPAYHGGGLHESPPGGELGLHLDSERHPGPGPLTGFQRRLNLVLYVSPLWREEWGGELVLYDACRRPVTRIAPLENRAVLFACDGRAYHGHAPVTGPYPRQSLAVFYWSPPRSRARFVAAAGEACDAAREAERKARAA